MEYNEALKTVWKLANGYGGAAQVCTGVILGLYNGSTYPFDLTDLKLLDKNNQSVVLNFIAGSLQSRREIHLDIKDYIGSSEWDSFIKKNGKHK